MASRDLRGLTIEIGGDTSNLTSALRDVDGELSNLQSNLRTVNSALRLDPGNVEALAQRQALLTDAVAETAERLEMLREAQRQVDRQIADGVDVDQRAYRSLQAEITRTEASLADYQRQASGAVTELDRLTETISQQENELRDLQREYSDAVLTYGRSSTEARTLSDRIDELSDELETNHNRMRDARHATEQAGDAAEDSAEGWTILKGTIADLASNAIQNVISSIGNLAGTLWNLDDDTRELRTNMGKLETAFQTSGYTVDDAKAAFSDFYAIVADEGQATEAVSHLAKLTDSQKELEQWTTIATGVYATFGDSLPIENLTEAANETAKTAKLTGGLADALNWAGVNEDEFQKKLDATNTEAEREALIRETLTGLYADAAEGYRETNGQIMEANKAQADYNAALAGLGDIVEPLKTAFRNGMTEMLEAASDFLEGVDMESVKASIQDAFDYILNTVFPTIKSGIQWFIDNKDTVITALSAIVAGIAAFKVVSVVQAAIGAFNAFQTATSGLTIAQKALNLVLGNNPIARVVTVVAALVGAFITAYQTSETFRNIVNGAMQAVWKVVQPIAESIKNALVQAWELIKVVWSYCEPFFETLWNNIKVAAEFLKNQLVNFFQMAWTIIQNVWAVASGFFQNIWNTIAGIFSVVKSVLSGDFQSAWDAIKGIVSGWAGYFQTVWNSIKNIFGAVVTFFKNTFSNAWTAVKGVFSNWGSFFGGLWDSIKSKFSSIGTSIANAIGGAVKSGINGVISSIERTINSGVGLINGAIGLINKIPGVSVGTIGNLNLPRLASGHVAREPMIAEIGEYSGASRNPEIVTPQNILRETFEETLAKFALNRARTSDTISRSDAQGLATQIGELRALVAEYLPEIATKSAKNIYLDKKRLVGELASDMDEALGDIANRRAVGAV